MSINFIKQNEMWLFLQRQSHRENQAQACNSFLTPWPRGNIKIELFIRWSEIKHNLSINLISIHKSKTSNPPLSHNLLIHICNLGGNKIKITQIQMSPLAPNISKLRFNLVELTGSRIKLCFQTKNLITELHLLLIRLNNKSNILGIFLFLNL